MEISDVISLVTTSFQIRIKESERAKRGFLIFLGLPQLIRWENSIRKTKTMISKDKPLSKVNEDNL